MNNMKEFEEWIDVLNDELKAYGYFGSINPEDLRAIYSKGYKAEDVALMIWEGERTMDASK